MSLFLYLLKNLQDLNNPTNQSRINISNKIIKIFLKQIKIRSFKLCLNIIIIEKIPIRHEKKHQFFPVF